MEIAAWCSKLEALSSRAQCSPLDRIHNEKVASKGLKTVEQKRDIKKMTVHWKSKSLIQTSQKKEKAQYI